MIIDFSKYSGCGNDFILIDNRTSIFPIYNSKLVQQMCYRQNGIGADGIILLEESKICDFKMRIFNADGTEAEMCGNGIRCLGKFLIECDGTGSQFTIETMERNIPIKVEQSQVTVDMGAPLSIIWDQTLICAGTKWEFDSLNTGVPHAVIIKKNIETIDVSEIGQVLRHHSQFSPNGSNINFVAILDSKLHIRTYERGVEAETLACGTGAAAAAYVAVNKYQIPKPVQVITRSGDSLFFDFDNKNILMTGPAQFIFKGEFTTID